MPRKNIRPLAGRPLLDYTARAALGAKRLTRTVLSTDDEQIAAMGRQCGLDVPFLRPTELAQDTTPTFPVVKHALEQAEATDGPYDAACLLQPTHPMRTSATIDACIDLLERSPEVDAVFTVLRVPAHHHPYWVYFPQPDGTLRLSTGECEPKHQRQALPPAWHREGSVYVTRRRAIFVTGNLYGNAVLGYEVDPATSVNIDSLDDWERAEQLIAK